MNNYKKWKEYGNEVKKAEDQLFKLLKSPFKMPKNITRQLTSSINNLSNYKCLVEDEMLKQETHEINKKNERNYLNIFYGGNQ